MTQEEKFILLKDLSARLPYGVKCINICWPRDGYVKISNIDANCQKVQIFEYWCDINDCKPYLRPMSSMTEKEVAEFESITDELLEHGTSEEIWNTVMDWLNAHHFDHRHLIEKGLALEAPEGMYKID